MREEVAELCRLVKLLHTSRHADAENDKLPHKIHIPVTTKEEILELDQLLQDNTNLAALVNHLSVFCSCPVKETVDRVLKEILTNNVACEYNLRGRKGKHPFKKLQIMSAMYKLLRRSVSTRTATHKDEEDEVTKWLAGARDRDGGRKKRSGKATDVTEQENGIESDEA